MIRQAHTYLVGALSGVAVIAIAIGAFVVLVSAQVFHDLPIPALSSSDQKTAVSTGKAISSPDRQVASTGGVTVRTGPPNHPVAKAAGQAGAVNSQPTRHHQAGAAVPTNDATAPAGVVETATGGGESSTSTGGHSGTHSDQSSSSSSSSPSQTSSSSPSSGGGGSNSSTTSSGSSGSGNSATGTSGSGGSGGGSTGSGGGSTTTSPPSTPVTTAKPSEEVAEGINKTVGGVDEALGGGLGESGVTHVTEEVVEGVAGPESVVGKTVDGVGEVVGGLVGGKGE